MENAPTRLLRGLIFVALRRAGADLTLEEAGTLLTRDIRQTIAVIGRAWSASMPAPEKRSKEKPQKKAEKPKQQQEWMEHWAAATSQDGLGLSEDQWLELTPRQVHALQKVRIERMQREEFLNGLVACTTANFSMSPPKKPLKADDFMIHKLPEEESNESIGDQIFSSMQAFKLVGAPVSRMRTKGDI